MARKIIGLIGIAFGLYTTYLPLMLSIGLAPEVQELHGNLTKEYNLVPAYVFSFLAICISFYGAFIGFKVFRGRNEKYTLKRGLLNLGMLFISNSIYVAIMVITVIYPIYSITAEPK